MEYVHLGLLALCIEHTFVEDIKYYTSNVTWSSVMNVLVLLQCVQMFSYGEEYLKRLVCMRAHV